MNRADSSIDAGGLDGHAVGMELLRASIQLLNERESLPEYMEAILQRCCSSLDIETLSVRLHGTHHSLLFDAGIPLAELVGPEDVSRVGLILGCLTGCLLGINAACLDPYRSYATAHGTLCWADAERLQEWLAHAPHDNCLRKMAAFPDLRGCAVIPIFLAGTAVGSLIALDRRTGHLTGERIQCLEAITDTLAAAWEQSLVRKRMHLMTSAFQQSAEGILVTDAHGTIEYVNPAFEQITGYERDEIIGQTPRILQSGRQTPEHYEKLWSTLNAGNSWQGLFLNRCKDGTEIEVKSTIFPVRDEAGHVSNYVSIQRDMTRESTLEAQLRQSQKMEAVGRLAGGIAHDFNNLLTSILGFSDLALANLPATAPIRADLLEIIENAERATRLTRQLLAFSRKQVFQIGPLNLNREVQHMEKLLKRTLGEHISLELDLSDPLPRITGDTGGIEQILLNLAVNAKDAMPEGGTLSIRTRPQTVTRERLTDNQMLEPGAYVHFSVSDTGCGMSADTRTHLFEPFFTTKPPEKGTGLGMSIVYGLVQQFRGVIQVESEVDQGTTIHIYLPATLQADPQELQSQDPTVGLGGDETILVVEDDASLRRLIMRLLPSMGYKVYDAANGVEALKILEREGSTIDLLFTDLVMPEMGGMELVQQARRLYPALPVLLTTGFSHDLHVTGKSSAPTETILIKPYNQATLRRTIRAALDAPPIPLQVLNQVADVSP